MLQAMEGALRDCRKIGQLSIQRLGSNGFALTHCDDESRNDLEVFRNADNAVTLSKFDDAGNYRPLKTAPNLRHGWRMEVIDLPTLERALDYFYPGRLSIFAAWQAKRLQVVPLRDTLDRQSGMYRIAATISDDEIDEVVGSFCRTDGGCLRTILWRRDRQGTIPSQKLPAEKFIVSTDDSTPLLCQEACNLLVNECRKVVKTE
jgi:sirohydrochlorin cobaltochelatase